MEVSFVSSAPTKAVEIRQTAEKLEASFLAEMLKGVGLGALGGSFGGGAGEEQFASLMREEQAKLMVEAGGIGLSGTLGAGLDGEKRMNRVVTLIGKLLEQERAALISGDFSTAVGLAKRKDALVAKLEKSGADAGDLVRVREMAQRNMVLLQAARRGVEAARQRIVSIRDGSGFRTYGADGATHEVKQLKADLERRA